MQMSDHGATILNHPIVQRAISLATLQHPTLRAIARDPRATAEAAIVIAAASIANAIGSSPDSFREFVLAFVIGFGAWYLFTILAFYLGTNIFSTPLTHTTPEILIRTLGYARGPAILSVVGFVPIFGGFVTAIAGVWVLFLSVWIIRYTLGLSILRSIVTIVLAGALSAVITAIPALIFGVGFDIMGNF